MDPISDFLIRIKNAVAVSKETVVIPHSKFKMEIAKVLKNEGFIGDAAKKGKKAKKIIEISLKYGENGKAAIEDLKIVSKPGRRVYRKYNELRPVKYGFGISLVSTPRGLMTNLEAKKRKLGGEVLCEIW